MEFVNLTPHDIHVRVGNEEKVIPASGKVARVAVDQKVVGEVDGVPVVSNSYGKVENLPDYTDDETIYIVSSMVLQAVHQRADVVAPDTGSTAIRNEKGQIVAVTRFVIKDDDFDDFV